MFYTMVISSEGLKSEFRVTTIMLSFTQVSLLISNAETCCIIKSSLTDGKDSLGVNESLQNQSFAHPFLTEGRNEHVKTLYFSSNIVSDNSASLIT